MYIDTLVIGSGIAGLSVAYYLKKEGIDFNIITKSNNLYMNNTAISYCNTRIPNNTENTIATMVEQCGSNEEIIRKIYSNTNVIYQMFDDLNIKYKKTKFGIMPYTSSNKMAGMILIEMLVDYIGEVQINKMLVDVLHTKDYNKCLIYNIKTQEFENIICNHLIVSTGGFAGAFKYNDNIKDIVGDGHIILKKIGSTLKAMSTIMWHPFGILNGNKVLTGDIVSLCDGNVVDKYGEKLEIDEELKLKISQNNYHNSDNFTALVKQFKKLINEHNEIYLDFTYADKNVLVERLSKNKLNSSIVKEGKIRIIPTAHYTSGGVVIDNEFRVLNNVFANGEIIFDGMKGIGRIPGHALSSSIVGAKIIVDSIKKDIGKSYDISNVKDNELELLNIFSDKDNGYDISKIEEKNLEILQKVTDTNFKCYKYELEHFQEIINNMLKDIIINAKCDKSNIRKVLKIYYKLCITLEVIEDKMRRN